MRLAACALALSQAGCSLIYLADAGYAHAFAQAPERSAATINAYVGGGTGGHNGGAGVGATLRGKISDAVGQFSGAPFVYGIVGPSGDVFPPWALYALGGVDLFTVETVGGKGSASIGSPFVEVGGYVRVAGPIGITAGVSFEDDIRFNDVPNTGYVSFLLGASILDWGGNPLQ